MAEAMGTWGELAVFVALLAVAAVLLIGRTSSGRRGGAAVAVASVALGLAGLGLWRPGGDPALAAAVPGPVEDGGFASSDTCRSCHPGPYQSWHRSFHRTMTQRATPEAVHATFDGSDMENRGLVTRLERRGDAFWADMPDPLWLQHRSPDDTEAPRIEARVVMTTGSHHLQNFWVRRPAEGDVYLDGPDNGALVQVPWVWLIDEGRWVPTQDSFLTPPRAAPDPPQVWNSACFGCHAVAAQPRFAGDRFETRSVELGIACEACHGPAEEHVRANRSPLRRYLRHFTGDDDGDPTIVNPVRLDKERSAAVCGQCHSFGAPPDMEGWKETGTTFRAGEELAPSRAVFRYTEEPSDPLLLRTLEGERDALDGRFWRDGTMRVAGREYNGLIESPCFEQGEMTCLSCHAMHDYEDRSDQLAGDRLGDASCLECHANLGEEHTRHPAASEGSRCANCHMPHTTYGLFAAMRSHRIDSPSAAVTAETGRPNACNLCHLDRTLEWTSRWLEEWYGQEPPPLAPEQREVASSVLHTLRGDAAQRAITAWHFGWEPALEASGRGWQVPYVMALLGDPYAAIRRVAGRSLRAQPGFEDFRYDYVAPEPELRGKMEAVMTRWERGGPGEATDRPELLLDASGRVDAAIFAELMAERDHRPLRIIE